MSDAKNNLGDNVKHFFRSWNALDNYLANSKLGNIAKEGSDKIINVLSEELKDVKNTAGRHITKIMLVTALGSGLYYHADNSSSPENNVKELIDVIPSSENAFWDHNSDFFDKTIIQSPLLRETLAPGVEVIRDVGLTFYVVQEGDTRDKIKEKLSRIKEFSYLSRPEYDDKIKSFNVPKDVVVDKVTKQGHAGRFFIPIPLDSKVRTFSMQDFAFYAKQGIDDIKNHPVYKDEIQKLLKNCSEDELVAAMVAFARSETASEHETFTSPIGSTEFHRWEEHMKAFSFTPYHILMEKNADGKTAGPGLKARLDLSLTEGQCYHPRNATALFLAYRCNKSSDLSSYFPIKPSNISQVASTYNGSLSYAPKLESNYTYALDMLGITSKNWKKDGSSDKQNKKSSNSEKTLENKDFVYERLSSTGQKVYSYVVQSGGNPGGVKKQFRKQFPSYTGIIEVVQKDGSAYNTNDWISGGNVVYVKIDK